MVGVFCGFFRPRVLVGVVGWGAACGALKGRWGLLASLREPQSRRPEDAGDREWPVSWVVKWVRARVRAARDC